MLGRKREMCKRVERICQVDPDGWYAPVIGEELIRCKDCQYYSPFTETTVSWCPITRLKGLPADAYCYVAEKKEKE